MEKNIIFVLFNLVIVPAHGATLTNGIFESGAPPWALDATGAGVVAINSTIGLFGAGLKEGRAYVRLSGEATAGDSIFQTFDTVSGENSTVIFDFRVYGNQDRVPANMTVPVNKSSGIVTGASQIFTDTVGSTYHSTPAMVPTYSSPGNSCTLKQVFLLIATTKSATLTFLR